MSRPITKMSAVRCVAVTTITDSGSQCHSSQYFTLYLFARIILDIIIIFAIRIHGWTDYDCVMMSIHSDVAGNVFTEINFAFRIAQILKMT